MQSNFILQNFALLCISLVMVILLIQNYKSKRFMFGILIGILTGAISLAAVVTGEYYMRIRGNLIGTTWMTFLGYAIRPFCLYGFMLLARHRARKLELLLLIPPILNVIVYSSALFVDFPPLGHLTYYYVFPETGTELIHTRGPLNFTSHILCGLYLAYTIYLSIARLSGKHRSDALSILICASFTVAAVIIEMTGLAMGVLNLSIGISVVFYYLFLLREENRKDALTSLFDRKTFYDDWERYNAEIRAVIQLDMNGLKPINDAQGHLAGDKALKTLSAIFLSHASRNMYVYRLGGDEFTILFLGRKAPDLQAIAQELKDEVQKAGYSISVGCALRGDGAGDLETMIHEADQDMYRDKAEYYRLHPSIDRRRGS